MGLFPGEVADREASDGPDAVVLTTSAQQGRRRIPPRGARRGGAYGGAELDTAAAEGLARCCRSAGGPALGLRAGTEGKDSWDPGRHNT